MLRIAVVGEDDDAVASLLQADGRIDDEALRSADAQIGMEEDDGALCAVCHVSFAEAGRGG